MLEFLRSPLLRKIGLGIALLTLLYMIVLPLRDSTTNATLFTLTLMLTTVGVAVNWNLTGGFTGYVDFGHAVWFGVGGYVTAILMSRDPHGLGIVWGPLPSILIGAIVAGLLAALIGRATMRLKGPYFSIAMLGTFVATREIVRVSEPLTGGGVGLTLPPYINRPLFYYIQLGLVVALILFSWWLRRTRFGSALVAIREDEIGAEMRGINATRTKVTVFSFAGMSTGLFGGLWAYQNTFVDPDIAFVELRTVEAVMGTMLGGIGTVAGPVIGAITLFWLKEILWENFLDFHLIAQGLLLIIIVLYIPKGLVGIFDPRSASITSLFAKWLGGDSEDAYGANSEELVAMKSDSESSNTESADGESSDGQSSNTESAAADPSDEIVVAEQ
jgi:branched-chain amino acid transport system permease protein